jgi:hypothetical protein
MSKYLVSRDLVPFRRRSNGYRLPKIESERDDEIRQQIEPDLDPEEETFVLHYLRYADTLLAMDETAAHLDQAAGASIPEKGNVLELPINETIKKDAA